MFYQALINRLKGEWRVILTAVCLGFIFTFVCTGYTYYYSEQVVDGISEEVIRFHVKANSDSPEDQALKTTVKEQVLLSLKDGLSGSLSKEETRAYLSANIPFIEATAARVISENGYNYPVTARLTNENFPTKTYGDVSFPAGQYEALRIDIGEAEGSNWWCIMFPPLCYVDVTKKEIPDEEKQLLKYVLTDDEYTLVTESSNKARPDIEIKFKLVEWWQNRKQSNQPIIVKR